MREMIWTLEPSSGHMWNLPTLILQTNVDCFKMSESWGFKIIYILNLILKKSLLLRNIHQRLHSSKQFNLM